MVGGSGGLYLVVLYTLCVRLCFSGSWVEGGAAVMFFLIVGVGFLLSPVSCWRLGGGSRHCVGCSRRCSGVLVAVASFSLSTYARPRTSPPVAAILYPVEPCDHANHPRCCTAEHLELRGWALPRRVPQCLCALAPVVSSEPLGRRLTQSLVERAPC